MQKALTAQATVGPSLLPLVIRQAFNTLVDAYVLWSWTQTGMCGMKGSGLKYPLRPKDVDSFASGTWIEVDNAAQWTGLLASYGWYAVQATAGGGGIFQYRADIGVLHDVHYRQVHAWQRWFQQNNLGLAINPSGVFDATTQERMDMSPILGYAPNDCTGALTTTSSPPAARAGTLTNLLPPANITQAQGELALVIIVPMSVTAFALALVVVMTTVVGLSGPRVPMGGKGRAHEDPYWIEQYDASDVASKVGEMDADGATEWEEWENRDPEIWSELPSEWPTEDLEEEMLYMREHAHKPKYPPAPERQYGAGAAVGNEDSGVSTEEAVAVAAPLRQPQATQRDEPPERIGYNSNIPTAAATPQAPTPAVLQQSETGEDEDEVETDEDTKD